MGMQRTIVYAGPPPPWPAVREQLYARDYPVEMRMIDGQLAFPDEEPPDEWRELRVSIHQGMTTLRREGNRIVVVTWGNAEGPVRQAWEALTAALAETGEGRIEDSAG